MSMKDKYYKYKLKYLNAKKQLGSGEFSRLQYDINENGDIISKRLIASDDYYNHKHIMGVYEKKKICSSFTSNELLSNIKQYNLSLNEILKTCLIIEGTELKNDISEEIFNSICYEQPYITILYFADNLSAQTYMNIYNNNNEIFPREILLELFAGLRTIYSPKIYVNKSYLFHIFHGIIFSYDIKDIYGFIKEYRDKFGELVKFTDDPVEKQQVQEQLNNLTIITKDIFFPLLSEIIDIIMKDKRQSALSMYVSKIKLENIDGNPVQNFKTISME